MAQAPKGNAFEVHKEKLEVPGEPGQEGEKDGKDTATTLW